MTHGEAIELIKNGGTAVRLLVRRARAPNAAFLGTKATLVLLDSCLYSLLSAPISCRIISNEPLITPKIPL